MKESNISANIIILEKALEQLIVYGTNQAVNQEFEVDIAGRNTFIHIYQAKLIKFSMDDDLLLTNFNLEIGVGSEKGVLTPDLHESVDLDLVFDFQKEDSPIAFNCKELDYKFHNLKEGSFTSRLFSGVANIGRIAKGPLRKTVNKQVENFFNEKLPELLSKTLIVDIPNLDGHAKIMVDVTQLHLASRIVDHALSWKTAIHAFARYAMKQMHEHEFLIFEWKPKIDLEEKSELCLHVNFHALKETILTLVGEKIPSVSISDLSLEVIDENNANITAGIDSPLKAKFSFSLEIMPDEEHQLPFIKMSEITLDPSSSFMVKMAFNPFKSLIEGKLNEFFIKEVPAMESKLLDFVVMTHNANIEKGEIVNLPSLLDGMKLGLFFESGGLRLQMAFNEIVHLVVKDLNLGDLTQKDEQELIA